MAETSLAVSFAPLDRGLEVDHVDRNRLAERREAHPTHDSTDDKPSEANSFVHCGAPIPSLEVEVRDDNGCPLPDRCSGTIYVKGSSVMAGYFGDPERTREALSGDGWLDTGDIGYRVNGSIVIIGRKKDVIIINGRNIWPQDMEHLAEELPEVRPGDVSAFSVQVPDQSEMAVMVVQCRESDEGRRDEFVKRLQTMIREHLGLDCFIDLVPPHTLPRTSSGKLSRSKTREEFLKRVEVTKLFPAQTASVNGQPAKTAHRDHPTASCVALPH